MLRLRSSWRRVYLSLCEADSLEKVGKALTEVHKELDSSTTFTDLVKSLLKNPAATAVSQAMNAGFALLAPIGKILQSAKNDHIGLAQGTFPATKGWEGRLIQKFPDGSYIQLAEVGE